MNNQAINQYQSIPLSKIKCPQGAIPEGEELLLREYNLFNLFNYFSFKHTVISGAQIYKSRMEKLEESVNKSANYVPGVSDLDTEEIAYIKLWRITQKETIDARVI